MSTSAAPVESSDSILQQKTIIGVDLGTSRSGFCPFFPNHTQPNTYNKWKEAPTPGPKTLSCMLYKGNSTSKVMPSVIGFEAEKMFKDLNEKKSTSGAYLVRGFKEKLIHKKSHLKSADFGGIFLDVEDVYVAYLKKLLNPFLNEHSLTPDNIRWIVTIPANWEREQINVVKQIFHKANLISSENADESEISVVLEPEAAAVYCAQEKLDDLQLTDGNQCLLVDAGGGTTDTTSFEMVNGKLKMTSISDAISVGSTDLDKGIFDILKRDLGTDFNLLTYEQLFEIYQTWEKQKVKLDSIDKRVVLKFSNPDPKIQNHSRFKTGGFLFSKEDLQSIFNPVIDKIVESIENIVNSNDISFDYLIMVGGLSQCKPLIERIKNTLDMYFTSIVVPDFGGESVVKGAAYLGRYPDLISVRKSKYSYGINSEREFDFDKDDQSRLKKVPGNVAIPYLCTGVFSPIIKKNQEVRSDFIKTLKYIKNDVASTMGFEIYRSVNTIVKYVDEPFCQVMCNVTLDINDLSVGENITVEARLDSTNTNLILSIKSATGKKVNTTVLFQSETSLEKF
ncbi:hypothetical protein ABK040_015998 [Willaertia magna]